LCFVREVLNLVQIIISPNALLGLSFGIDGLAALEGTLLFDEIMQAKQVIPLWFVIYCSFNSVNHCSIGTKQ
jgi:hypothetical protein